VPEKDHVQYVHGKLGVKFDYDSPEVDTNMPCSPPMPVCNDPRLP